MKVFYTVPFKRGDLTVEFQGDSDYVMEQIEQFLQLTESKEEAT